MRRKFERKKIDWSRTLKSFECRMMSLDLEVLRGLENKFLSSYEVFDTFLATSDEILDRYDDSNLDGHVWRLAHVCLQRDIKIRGITSARMIHGKRSAALPENELKNIVFVGRVNNFCHLIPHPIFKLGIHDMRYLNN